MWKRGMGLTFSVCAGEELEPIADSPICLAPGVVVLGEGTSTLKVLPFLVGRDQCGATMGCRM